MDLEVNRTISMDMWQMAPQTQLSIWWNIYNVCVKAQKSILQILTSILGNKQLFSPGISCNQLYFIV